MTASSLETLRTTRQLGPLAHLPVWENFEPATVKAALAAAIEEADAAFTSLEQNAVPTWGGLLAPLGRHARVPVWSGYPSRCGPMSRAPGAG